MSDPMVIKKELLFNEYTWCEDGNCGVKMAIV